MLEIVFWAIMVWVIVSLSILIYTILDEHRRMWHADYRLKEVKPPSKGFEIL